jgi:hypothetical protein
MPHETARKALGDKQRVQLNAYVFFEASRRESLAYRYFRRKSCYNRTVDHFISASTGGDTYFQ